MHRRKFVSLTGMGITAGALAESLVASQMADATRHDMNAAPRKAQMQTQMQARMKVGHQHYSSDGILTLLAAFGVNNICSDLPSRKFDENWSAGGLTKLRERVESFGIKLEMVPLPLSSAYITKAENPNIMLGKSPERDREIDDVCQMIRNAARAGIPALKYNMSVLGVVRTEPTKGRGGADYSTFVYDKAKQEPPLTEAGPVNEDVYWERITHFLSASFRW